MENLLNTVRTSCVPFIKEGRVASYIPELAKANPSDFGICMATITNECYAVGDYAKGFTIQSIVKPIILLMALQNAGEEAVNRLVSAEATGKPFDTFNYSDQALSREHINPMINTGAIALCPFISGETYRDKLNNLLAFTRILSGNPQLKIDRAVYSSEKQTGHKNRALAYMLKAYGMLEADVEEVLDLYFSACSITVTALDLAHIATVFANGGVDVVTEKRLFEASHARYINAVLMTCGMYDGSGEFALTVGVPAKSGVGGGIMAVVPHRMGIGLYSPALDSKGNSVAGIQALKQLSRQLNLSIF